MDALKLNFVAKDQLYPWLSKLIASLNNVSDGDYEGRPKMVQWLIILNHMEASEEISPEQSRQLLFDIESAYNAFFKTLGQ